MKAGRARCRSQCTQIAISAPSSTVARTSKSQTNSIPTKNAFRCRALIGKRSSATRSSKSQSCKQRMNVVRHTCRCLQRCDGNRPNAGRALSFACSAVGAWVITSQQHGRSVSGGGNWFTEFPARVWIPPPLRSPAESPAPQVQGEGAGRWVRNPDARPFSNFSTHDGGSVSQSALPPFFLAGGVTIAVITTPPNGGGNFDRSKSAPNRWRWGGAVSVPPKPAGSRLRAPQSRWRGGFPVNLAAENPGFSRAVELFYPC